MEHAIETRKDNSMQTIRFETIDRVALFDGLYAEASSSLRDRRVFLKGCRIVSRDPASGHGFGAGLREEVPGD